jgi:hypothetical protein
MFSDEVLGGDKRPLKAGEIIRFMEPHAPTEGTTYYQITEDPIAGEVIFKPACATEDGAQQAWVEANKDKTFTRAAKSCYHGDWVAPLE